MWGKLDTHSVVLTTLTTPFSLPGIVGDMEDGIDNKEYIIMTHKKFDIGYNGNQVHAC